MVQTFVFNGDAPERLNVQELEAEMQGIEPAVYLEFYESINWPEYPYRPPLDPPDFLPPVDPEDWEDPYIQPDTLIVYNVPDGITRQQVRQFILDHLPEETTEEQRRRETGDKAVNILLNASDAKLLELKNKLLSV